MNLIVAADTNWAIGYGNKLLARIPKDQKFFRDMTVGKVVVMGRKTLESFPGKRPLKNRTNIIMTRNPSYRVRDAIVVDGIDALFRELEKYSSEDIYVIGGDSIYTQLLPYCDKAYVTKIDHAYNADTYFPNLDEDPDWALETVSEEQTYFDLRYVFIVYKHIS